MGPYVTVKDLCKSYGSLAVLDHWNLAISRGERLALLGPSGAGKTTFLKITSGLEKPSGGAVCRDNLRIGFVFQEPRLIPWCTVKNNLLFVNKNGNSREILAQLGLDDFENYLPSQLSGGMRQRVNLARALIIDPDILILDEAFHSLDLRVKVMIMKDIERLWQANRFTLIAVTHDPKEALFLADRIVLLSERPSHIIGESRVELGTDRKLSAPEFLRSESALIETMHNLKTRG